MLDHQKLLQDTSYIYLYTDEEGWLSRENYEII